MLSGVLAVSLLLPVLAEDLVLISNKHAYKEILFKRHVIIIIIGAAVSPFGIFTAVQSEISPDRCWFVHGAHHTGIRYVLQKKRVYEHDIRSIPSTSTNASLALTFAIRQPCTWMSRAAVGMSEAQSSVSWGCVCLT